MALTIEARRLGVREVHRLLTIRSGKRRVPLLVGIGPQRELCIGSTGFFTCYPPSDSRPSYAVAVFHGARQDPTWGAVVGLVSTSVSRVLVELQDGESQTPELTRWRGFPWAGFASRITGPNGHLPSSLVLVGARGGRSEGNGLGWFYTPDACANHLRPCPKRWTRVGDAFDAFAAPITKRARELAAKDPFVRPLLSDTDYTVEPITWGRPCDGRNFGAVLTYWLFRPISVDADFPVEEFRDGYRYFEGVVHVEASNVRAINVSVDVRRGRVVGVDPTYGDDLNVTGFRLVEPLRPGPRDGC